MTTAPVSDFVHLHVHSEYSLLDGAIRLPSLVNQAKAFSLPAVALTDHGTMHGALEFYERATKAGLKPIIGCELYVAPGSRRERQAASASEAAFHLVLLAMNKAGYQNLIHLASIAQLEGFYYKPRIDKEVLAQLNEGLIALTACLHGEIPHAILGGHLEAGRKHLAEYRAIFGDRFYLEIQENGLPEQAIVNQGLKTLARETGVPLVATNDCHYLTREEAHAHEVLLCVQTGKTIQDQGRFRFSTDQLYFKSPAEMIALFADCPEAIAATREIAERCHLELSFGQHHFPIFPVPEGESLESVFEAETRQGAEVRLQELAGRGQLTAELEKTYRHRLDMEIDVIRKMGFAGYFLIVADFINWAKKRDIPVGPGRGSGAGSLAAYCLRITDLDPIPYGLIFERFLNVERKSLPDFDVDFCQERRGEVIRYVQEKYGGEEHVAQIITFGKMKARAVIRDVGRALGMPFADVDRIAKLVPEQLKITIRDALEQEPRLKDAQARDPQTAELLAIAQVLEGLPRHTSTHAAGVVVSPGPIWEYLPVCRGKDGEILTQYDMKYTEKTGLIKFDFLGLKTLTVIDRAVKLIGREQGRPLDIAAIPLDDPKTYDLLCRGDALGVFQLESSGMRALLTSMRPELFTDLVALVALYRPGPLDSGMVDTFVDTKHGRKPAAYPLPQLEPVLEETYGVIVYQEQVMKIANILANYSLGEADILRRAMGKKDPEVMKAEKGRFLAGAEANRVPRDKAEHVFDLVEKFAGYGFNKSHSAAYALVAYQTAYLKAHYPAQFMAALLSCDMNNTDKVVLYINECKDHGIEVLPPDINESDQDFTVVGGRIRFGLAAVKNVGGSALESITEARSQDGPFASLEEFCARVDSRRVNRRVIESLIKAGAFDSLGGRRPQYLAILDQALEQAQAAQRDRQSGQLSLFAALPETTTADVLAIPLPAVEEWPDKLRLAQEKETVGFYLTGHPLDSFREDLKAVTDADCLGLAEWPENGLVRVGGLVRTLKEHKSKKGDRMGFVTLEDLSGSIEVVVFPEVFARSAHLLTTEEPIVVLGIAKRDDREEREEKAVKIIAEAVDSVAEARKRYTEGARIVLDPRQVDRGRLTALKGLLYRHPGPCPVAMTVHFDGRGEVDISMPEDLAIGPSRDLTQEVNRLLGYPAIRYSRKSVEACRPAPTNGRRGGGRRPEMAQG
ncbi:MAG: DNA polymerase III subunit alpha [Thermodesulfobacteriota bacterium]